MENFNIDVELRAETGKGACNKYRREGKIPVVVYHRSEESVYGLIPYKEFVQMAKKAASSTVFQLKSGIAGINGRAALVKEVQKDTVSSKVMHVDFQALRDDEEITVKIPVRIVGESPGVKTDGGILAIVSHEVTVSCFPKAIPHHVEVDISTLQLGESIHAKDLKFAENVKLQDDPEETIVSVVMPRAAEEATPAADATAVAAGAAATPAAGVTPAAGAAKGAAPAAAKAAPAAAKAAPAAAPAKKK